MTTQEIISDNLELIKKKGETLDSLHERSVRIQNECSDYTIIRANSNSVRLNDQAGITYVVSSDGEVRHSQMSRYAMSQLGSKIGVPVNYLEKCIKSGRLDLAQENVNSFLLDYDKNLFVREYKGCVRGVLSSKYSVCDTPEIIEAVNEAISGCNYRVKGSFLSPERFHVRLVSKDSMNIEGEDLFHGISIDSSDVGRSVLTCNFMIYKQVCTNGLVVQKGAGVLFQQKHIGIDPEEFSKDLRKSLDLVPDLVAQMEGAINNSREILVSPFISDEEINKEIALLRQSGMSIDTANKVIDIFQSKRYEPNQWGLINSITEASQSLTLEKRLDLERYAGNMLLGLVS